MIFDLAGRTALVTGGGQGIGAGIARHLATQGAHVLVGDVVGERAEAVVAALRGEGRTAEALAIWRRIVNGSYWAAFGFIAAEAELYRLGEVSRPRVGPRVPARAAGLLGLLEGPGALFV